VCGSQFVMLWGMFVGHLVIEELIFAKIIAPRKIGRGLPGAPTPHFGHLAQRGERAKSPQNFNYIKKKKKKNI